MCNQKEEERMHSHCMSIECHHEFICFATMSQVPCVGVGKIERLPRNAACSIDLFRISLHIMCICM